MPINALFGLSILISFVAFGLVTRLYVWPWLQRTPRNEALTALVVPHAFRFVGLSFLQAAPWIWLLAGLLPLLWWTTSRGERLAVCALTALCVLAAVSFAMLRKAAPVSVATAH